MFNKVLIIGNVGRDPELRYTPAGQAVANFPVASNYRYTASSGEKRSETEWFQVSAWGKLAEAVNQYVKTGDLVFIEGRLKTNKYEGKDGQTHFSVEVFCTGYRLLSAAQAQEEMGPGEEDYAGDLPF